VTAALILGTAVLSLSWWLGIAQMLAACWPVALPIGFSLVWIKSGRSAFFWADAIAEALIDMAADAPVTFRERFRERVDG
jgi:hypothetical protein